MFATELKLILDHIVSLCKPDIIFKYATLKKSVKQTCIFECKSGIRNFLFQPLFTEVSSKDITLFIAKTNQ